MSVQGAERPSGERTAPGVTGTLREHRGIAAWAGSSLDQVHISCHLVCVWKQAEGTAYAEHIWHQATIVSPQLMLIECDLLGSRQEGDISICEGPRREGFGWSPGFKLSHVPPLLSCLRLPWPLQFRCLDQCIMLGCHQGLRLGPHFGSSPGRAVN